MKKKNSKNKKLIIANWKMAPDSLFEAKKIFSTLKKKKINSRNFTVVLCPPVVYFSELFKNYRGKIFKFGIQNLSHEDDFAHTGEISAKMAKDFNVQYVIIGHAERRALGEDSSLISKKIKNTLKHKMTPVLCVGEIIRDQNGEYLKFLEQQIIDSLSGVKKNQIEKVVIVYEPVWAIGKGHKAVNNYEIYQMTIFIKKILVSLYGRKSALNVSILYGGSVDAENCLGILEEGRVDGLLIGRASLNPFTFSDILKKI